MQKAIQSETQKLTAPIVQRLIKEGEKYTYAELCRHLSQPTYKGTQKIAQLKDFERYFKYEKEDKYYTILKIYSRAKSKKPNKLRSDSKFTKYIEYLLLNELYNNRDKKTLIMSYRQIWQLLSMANAKYFFFNTKQNRKALLNMNISDDMTLAHIISFFRLTNDKFYEILNNSLKSLKRRSFITVSDVFMIGNDIDHLREANDEEVSEWLKTRREILLKYNVENFGQARKILSEYQYDKMIDEMNDLQREELRYNFMFPKLKIIYHSYSMKETLEKDEPKIQKAKNELNKAIQDTIDNKLMDNIKKLKNCGFGDLNSLAKEDILTSQMHLLLSDYLIKLPEKNDQKEINYE